MKKTCWLLLFFGSVSFASPVNNPAAPKMIEEGLYFQCPTWYNFRIGYEGNFVRDGRMEMQNESKDIDGYQQDTNSGTFTLGLQNRFDFYGTVGAYRTKAAWRIKEFDDSFSRIQLETHYNLSWSAGVKGIFFEWGNTTLSAGSRYSNISSNLLWLTKNGVPQSADHGKLKYKEWQIDLAISHKIDFLIPYVGVQYNNTHIMIFNEDVIIAPNENNKIQLKGKEHIGLNLGCAITAKKYFYLNLEGRLINEYAFTVSGEFKF